MKYLLMAFFFISLNAFSLSVKSPSIKFTGYKFTEKAGVSGTFKKADWSLKSTGSSIKEILLGSSVVIDSYSIDAGKKARNVNIRNGLFKKWGGRQINGRFTGVDESKKMATLEIKIGKSVNTVEMNYKMKDNKLIIMGTIDLIKMGFEKAFMSLGKICAVHHKGKDGKIKTWSDVLIEITAQLTP